MLLQMALALPVALLWAAAPTGTAPQVAYDLAERAPIAYLVHYTAPASAAPISLTVIKRALDKALEGRTNLETQDVDPEAVNRCLSGGGSEAALREGLLTCLTRAAVSFKVGESGVFDDRWAELESQGKARDLALFLSVSPRPSKGGAPGDVRLSAVLLDVKRGMQEIDSLANKTSPNQQDQDDLEDRISGEFAIRVPIEEVSRDNAAMASYFEAALDTRLKNSLEDHGYFQAYGSIAVDNPEKKAKLQVDGKVLGEIPQGRVLVRNVPPGPHSVQIDRTGFDEFKESVLVAANQTTEVELGAVDRSTATTRKVMLWSGAGVAALGAIALVAGLAMELSGKGGLDPNPEGDAFTGCFSESNEVARRWYRLGGESNCHGSGLPLVPVGYSLLAMGGGTAASVYFTDQDTVPWIPAATSVVLGATALGLSLSFEDKYEADTPTEL